MFFYCLDPPVKPEDDDKLALEDDDKLAPEDDDKLAGISNEH